MDRSKLTAIARKRPSKPMQYLDKEGLLVGFVLDYGSGRGFDAAYYDAYRYDPNYYPHKPDAWKFDTITCNYVFCVVRRAKEKEILRDIQRLLIYDGAAYISVRRDIKGQHFRKNGTYQRRCVLDLPIVYENKQFAIYKLTKYNEITGR